MYNKEKHHTQKKPHNTQIPHPKLAHTKDVNLIHFLFNSSMKKHGQEILGEENYNKVPFGSISIFCCI